MTEKPLSTSNSEQSGELRRVFLLAARFLAPWLLILFALNFFVERWDPAPHYRATYQELYANAPTGAETLVLGASNGKYGVDPRALEPTMGLTLNLCLNGCGPRVYERWYYDIYLRYGRPPRCVVLVLNEYVFDPRYLTRQIEHDASHFRWPLLLRMAVDPSIELSTLLYNRLALTRRRAALWHAWFGAPVDEHVQMDKWYHGYAPVEADHPFARSPARLKFREDESRVEALRHFLLRLREDGIRVVIVNPPICLPSIEVVDPSGPHLREIARETGVEFFDYNRARASDLNQTRSLYMDWEHLNYEGSQRWSAQLAADLSSSASIAPTTNPPTGSLP